MTPDEQYEAGLITMEELREALSARELFERDRAELDDYLTDLRMGA